MLHHTGGRGEEHIRGNGSDHNGFNVIRRQATLGERLLRRSDREIARSCSLVYDMALADTGATGDPFVRSLDHFLKIRVAQNAGRDVGGESANFRAHKLGQ